MESVIVDSLKTMGVAGVVVIAACYLVKYFMGQIDKKDTRNESLNREFIAVVKEMADKNADQTSLVIRALTENTSALTELREAVRGCGFNAPIVGPRAADTVGVRTRHP